MEINDVEALMGAVATIAAALLYLARVLVRRFASEEKARKFQKYMPYAMMAAKKVEELTPDDFGTGPDAGRIARGAHKLDLFLREFENAVRVYEGEDPSQDLKEEAMRWSVELAERVGLDGALVDMRTRADG